MSPVTRTAVGTTLAGTALSALSTAPHQLTHLFRGRFPAVAVTGMTGVGKTCPADRIARRTSVESTVEVGSATMERRTRRSAKGRGFRFRVVPGDNAATLPGRPRRGLPRRPGRRDPARRRQRLRHPRRPAGTTGTAVATREEQLAAELEDWTITSHRIASMALRRDRPVWLVIVVTKADLFPDDLDEAVRYYSPGSGSPSPPSSTSCAPSPAGPACPSTSCRCAPNRARRPARPLARGPTNAAAPCSQRWSPAWPSSAVTSEPPPSRSPFAGWR
uniref:Uncharacterized protein n=1 Tax=Janibacter limosus TaxID=53458 RepID=A0AC61U3P9_9MICO|nr:hypothetical protein [Janibacter limosus]